MMNCCITRKKTREENAHRSQSTEIDDVEETGNISRFNYALRNAEKFENSLAVSQSPRMRNSSSARAKSWRARRLRQRGRN